MRGKYTVQHLAPSYHTIIRPGMRTSPGPTGSQSQARHPRNTLQSSLTPAGFAYPLADPTSQILGPKPFAGYLLSGGEGNRCQRRTPTAKNGETPASFLLSTKADPAHSVLFLAYQCPESQATIMSNFHLQEQLLNSLLLYKLTLRG